MYLVHAEQLQLDGHRRLTSLGCELLCLALALSLLALLPRCLLGGLASALGTARDLLGCALERGGRDQFRQIELGDHHRAALMREAIRRPQ